MPICSVALRLLLILGLILNGTGYSVAAAHLQMDASAMHEGGADAQDPQASAKPPCHGQVKKDTTASPKPAWVAMPGAETPSSGHSTPDCCKAGSCHCACTQQAPYALALQGWRGLPGINALGIHPLAVGHPAPALAQLIRPPIG